jgi:hypothetical protein
LNDVFGDGEELVILLEFGIGEWGMFDHWQKYVIYIVIFSHPKKPPLYNVI